MTTQTNLITQALNRFTERVVVRVVEEVIPAIQSGNPVDTGFSRNNWIPRIGEPYEGTAGTYEQARAGVLNPVPREQGLARLRANYRLQAGVVYITNNVGYINILNTLHPQSAFVQRGIVSGIRRAIGTV